MNYTVKLFEVPPYPPNFRPGIDTPPSPIAREAFGVDAPAEDQAKTAAVEWLAARGKKVRSIGWGPGDGGKPQLIAYVTA